MEQQKPPQRGRRIEPSEGSTPASQAERWPSIERSARALGFCRAGLTSAEPFARGQSRLDDWLTAGFHGEMAYMTQPRHLPERLLEGVRSLIAVALPYERPPREPTPEGLGYVASYAGGSDYHEVVKAKLWTLAQCCADALGQPLNARACVDTAPLLEREVAVRAGIAVPGKSTLAIVPGAGTFVLLGVLLLDRHLGQERHLAQDLGSEPGVEPEPTNQRLDPCGDCTACLDACPTQAFAAPHVLDARRCISYLTIEHRGPIAEDLRRSMGPHVFGCDICQQVCPFNQSRKAPKPAAELKRPTKRRALNLEELLQMGSSAHRRLVQGTAMSRVSRARLQRNAAIALGNGPSQAAVQPLARALRQNSHPLVRAHAAWALGQLGAKAAELALAEALAEEQDETVRSEIHQAIQRSGEQRGLGNHNGHA